MGVMTSGRIRFVAFALAALAAVGVFVIHSAVRSHRAAVRAAAKSSELAAYGIVTDGYADFTSIPVILAHVPAKSQLGMDIYTSPCLAATRRRTCAACHLLNCGGSDSKLHGGYLTRPFVDAVFAKKFLHDGSADFRAAVSRMVESRDFCGGESLEKACQRLAADPAMMERFRTVYGGVPSPESIVDSIAQLARTKVTSNRKFDLRFGGNVEAYSAQEEAGSKVFRRRCLECHEGPALGATKVVDGCKVPKLRGLFDRTAWLSDGSASEIGTVLARMKGGDVEGEDRAALIAFLKTL